MKPVKTAAIALIFLILGSGIWALALMFSQNTLQNSSWVSEKCLIPFPLAGGSDTQLTRATLAAGRLNLQHYYGHQEVRYLEPKDLTSASWSFTLDGGSYLDFIYGGDQKSFSGLRLSARMGEPSMIFESDTEGKFLRQVAFPFSLVPGDGYHAELTDTPEGLSLKVNDESIMVFTGQHLKAGEFGFRSGMMGGVVSSADFVERDGHRIHESFFNTRHAVRIFATVVLTSLGLLLAGAALAALASKATFAGSFLRGAQFFALLGALWMTYDYFYYSQIEDGDGILEHAPDSLYASFDFEYARKVIFGYGYAFASGTPLPDLDNVTICEKEESLNKPVYYCGPDPEEPCEAYGFLDKGRPLNKKKTDFNVLFMGGSFTKGSGAASLNQTFFARTHRALAKRLYPKTLSSTNYSLVVNMVGMKMKTVPERLIEDFYRNLDERHYDVIVLTMTIIQKSDLGIIRAFFEYCREKGTIILLMPQPGNPEEQQKPGYFQFRNLTMATRAEEEKLYRLPNVEMFEIGNYLQEPAIFHSGTIWQDRAHATSYGQSLVSEKLTPAIYKILTRPR